MRFADLLSSGPFVTNTLITRSGTAVLSAAAALAFVWDPTPFLVNGSLGAKVNQTAEEAQSIFLGQWVALNFRGADHTTSDGGIKLIHLHLLLLS